MKRFILCLMFAALVGAWSLSNAEARPPAKGIVPPPNRLPEPTKMEPKIKYNFPGGIKEVSDGIGLIVVEVCNVGTSDSLGREISMRAMSGGFDHAVPVKISAGHQWHTSVWISALKPGAKIICQVLVVRGKDYYPRSGMVLIIHDTVKELGRQTYYWP